MHLEFEPELARLDRLLEDDVIFQQVKADLARRHPRSMVTWRPSTPVEVILRLLVVKHLYQWNCEQTEHFVGDSLMLRQFCRLGLAPVPDDTPLLRWATCLQNLIETLSDGERYTYVSTSAISAWSYQIQIAGCGDFRRHRGPHDGYETPDGVSPSWSSSPLVGH